MALVSPVLIWARMSRLQKLTVILPPPYNVSKENFSFLRSPDFSFPFPFSFQFFCVLSALVSQVPEVFLRAEIRPFSLLRSQTFEIVWKDTF